MRDSSFLRVTVAIGFMVSAGASALEPTTGNGYGNPCSAPTQSGLSDLNAQVTNLTAPVAVDTQKCMDREMLSGIDRSIAEKDCGIPLVGSGIKTVLIDKATKIDQNPMWTVGNTVALAAGLIAVKSTRKSCTVGANLMTRDKIDHALGNAAIVGVVTYMTNSISDGLYASIFASTAREVYKNREKQAGISCELNSMGADAAGAGTMAYLLKSTAHHYSLLPTNHGVIFNSTF